MRVLIVEPSPLARNIYRLILRRIAECRITEVEDLRGISPAGVEPRFDLVIIGERAFEGDNGSLRALCTDVPAWQRVPKIVVAVRGGEGRNAPWLGLSRTTIVRRPFPPAEFERVVKTCVKGH